MQLLPTSPRLRSWPGIYLLAFGLMVLLLAIPLLARLPAPLADLLPVAPDVTSALARQPLAFVPNQGQSEAAVLYEVRGTDTTLAFKDQEISWQIGGQSLVLNFVNANQSPAVTAGSPLPGTVNDFRGPDAANWQTGIPTYAGITYQGVYPGIDLRYEGQEGSLKSTFTVAPGASPAQILWQYRGAAALAVDEASGDLLVTLPDQSQLVEQAPVAWQEIGGRRVPVPVAYALAGNGRVGFELGRYNASRPLIIDPTIVYETTFDLGDFGRGLDVVADAGGNAYVLGSVIDASNDVAVAKLSPDGTLIYTTYLRGSGIDLAGGIALDGAGGVYVGGATDSEDFPILNAMQSQKNGVTREAFVAKLAAQDGSLQFSTYFGGSRSDTISDISLNDAGEIYLVGYTESTDLPTVNPIQGGLTLTQCFCEDTFVTKLSPDALTVLYSTYLGGSFEDYGQSIALDANDNIYITGRTQSDDFPTQSAIQPDRAGENQDEDLFVSKISADGSSLVYSTYLGGTNSEGVRRIAVDGAGNAFVAGSTQSEDFPTTTGAFHEDYVGGVLECGTAGFGGPVNCTDMFVTKFAPDGSSLAYSTFVAGSDEDDASAVAINDAGEAYVVGYTSSTDFPGRNSTELGADIVVVKLNAGGSDLLHTVVIDSAVANAGHGITVDDAGDVIVTGAQNAPSDFYVAKISDDGSAPPPPTPTSTPVPPTPTPPAGDSTTHTGDLDGSSAWVYRRWFWRATVTITVHDGNHDPVAGATVNGSWSGGDSGSAQCTTGSDGSCVVSTGNIWRRGGNATLTVNDVTHSSFTYTPADDHDSDGDSDGVSITVSRP